MKKTSNFDYQFSNGWIVQIKVERTYGFFQTTFDGLPSTEFVNYHTLYITLPELGYNQCQPSQYYLDENGVYNICVDNPKTKKRHRLQLSKELSALIHAASIERLTDEIPPEDMKDIRKVKNALSSNRVIPNDELKCKRKQHDDQYNEGGEGYNPFDSYVSAEFMDYMKKKYPEQF